MTIREVLSRIRWDPEFGAADFTLVCADRFSASCERFGLDRIRLEAGNRFSFTVQDDAGSARTIPFHRVREVHRNGQCIWARPAAEPEAP